MFGFFKRKPKIEKPKLTPEIAHYFKKQLSKLEGVYMATDYDPDDYNICEGLLFFSLYEKFYIDVEPVSNYSDISGIKDYNGWIFKLCKGAYVYRIYTNISDVIRNFDTFHDITAFDPYELEIKKRKLEDKLNEIQEDFE